MRARIRTNEATLFVDVTAVSLLDRLAKGA
jgi:hypothetical protein